MNTEIIFKAYSLLEALKHGEVRQELRELMNDYWNDTYNYFVYEYEAEEYKDNNTWLQDTYYLIESLYECKNANAILKKHLTEEWIDCMKKWLYEAKNYL